MNEAQVPKLLGLKSYNYSRFQLKTAVSEAVLDIAKNKVGLAHP